MMMNRKKYPRDKIPQLDLRQFSWRRENYTEKFFKNNIGSINTNWLYSTSFSEAKEWLSSFNNEIPGFWPLWGCYC